jgi:quinol monooxygenase YgiN
VAAFDALVADTVQKIRDCEPDTLVYISHTVRDRPNERIFYELYRDQQAFTTHEQQPHVQRFLRERGQYVESFTVDVLEPSARR